MRTAVDKVGRGTCAPRSTRSGAAHAHRGRQGRARQGAPGQRPVRRHGQPLPVRSRVLQSGFRLGEGQIEKNVQDARHRLWQPTPSFASLAALNDWLETRCRELWAQTPHGSQPGSVADAWAEETALEASRPFDGFVEYANLWTPPLQGDFDEVSGAGCANLSGLLRSDDAPGHDGSLQLVAS